MEKSFVGMAHHVCPVCGIDHDPVVLINTRLRANLTDREFAGWKMCPEHQQLMNEGYTALIEVTNQPNSLANAHRTGRIMHVINSRWAQIFNVPLPDKGICFVDPEAFNKLEAKYNEAHDRHIMEQAEAHGYH